MKEDDIFRLYENTLSEERYFLSEHQIRLQFYLRIIMALLAGSAFGIYYFTIKLFVPLILAQIVTIYISYLGKKGSERLFQRFLEALTVRAKLEEDLQMITPRGNEGHWTLSEPYVNKRHLNSRKQNSDSEEWVSVRLHSDNNYQKIANSLFRVVDVVAIVIALYSAALFLINLLPMICNYRLC